MSFYGSIYYQLVDAFNRLWFRNQGRNGVSFPKVEDLVNQSPPEGVPADTFEYHSPGRQGVIHLKTGNRWITFTQDPDDHSFKLWHMSADTEDTIQGHGFCHVPHMYYGVAQGEENAQEAIDRILLETADKFEAEGKSFELVEDTRIVLKISEESNEYEIYKYNPDSEAGFKWTCEVEATPDLFTVLSPDDCFVTTEGFTVDKAGHIVASGRHIYKMPKSDVQEEIDELKSRMTNNEKHDEGQDLDIDLLEEYVGDWNQFRGYVTDKGSVWCPSISMAVGDMGELIAGFPTVVKEDGTIEAYRYYYNNRDVNLARVIGNGDYNLTALYEDLKLNDNAYFLIDDKTQLTDLSLIRIILYLKNNLIKANTAKASANEGNIVNLTYDINSLQNTVIPGIQEKDEEQDGRLDDLEAEETEVNKKIQALEEEDTILNKLISEHSVASSTAHNALDKRVTDLSTELKKEIDDDVAAASVDINKRIDDEIEAIEGEFEEVYNAVSDTLKTAQGYTDTEISELKYTDSTNIDGQYVYSVSEANGIISVTHKNLPTYTLATGGTIGTVAFNGDDIAVKGLGSAAYTDTTNFDAAGAAATAKSEAIGAAKTETENQIKALTDDGGAIQVNAKAIEDLQELLEDYDELVAKVAELERRIAALEPPPPEEPEPGPEEGTDDPEPNPDDPNPEEGEDPETT